MEELQHVVLDIVVAWANNDDINLAAVTLPEHSALIGFTVTSRLVESEQISSFNPFLPNLKHLTLDYISSISGLGKLDSSIMSRIETLTILDGVDPTKAGLHDTDGLGDEWPRVASRCLAAEQLEEAIPRQKRML